jgi:hypothetical protein
MQAPALRNEESGDIVCQREKIFLKYFFEKNGEFRFWEKKGQILPRQAEAAAQKRGFRNCAKPTASAKTK